MFISNWKFSTFCCTLVLISILYFIILSPWRRYKMRNKLNGFHTLPSLPIIGHVQHLSGTMKGRIRKMKKIAQEAKFPLISWIFHIPMIAVGSPEDILTVLNTSTNRRMLNILKYIFENKGILWGNGEAWQKSRRLMNPAFSAIMMQQYLIVFNEQSKILVNKISSVANTGNTINMWDFIASMNLDTITQNIADYKLNLQTVHENNFSQAIKTCTKLESMRLSKPWLLSEFIYNVYLLFTGNWNVYKQLKALPKQYKMTYLLLEMSYTDPEKNLKKTILQHIQIVSKQIVEKKIQNYALNKCEYESEEQKGKFPKTVIDILLKVQIADPEFTIEQLQIEILSMIGAGSDTTSITSSFTTLMLAMHPEAQEKAYEEVRSIFGEKPKTIQIEDINQLTYLEQCIKETLRLFSPVPVTVRQHDEDIKLNKKATIPAHCQVILPFYCIHHNPEYYPDPEAWIPERFDPENVTNQQKNAFMAFGAGPRMCIGMKYAMNSLKTQMAYLINNYRFTTDLKLEDIELTLDITLRNDEGYLVKIWSR